MGGDSASKDESIQLAFKSLTGESLTEMRVNKSWTVGVIAGKLAEQVPLPAKKIYTLVLGVDLLAAGDALSKHVTGDSAELIACADSDDESDESDDKPAKKKDKGKKKKKDSKNKGKKDKKKEKASSKKNKCKSESESEETKKKKAKKDKDLPPEDLVVKSAWIAERLGELRKIRPPLPPELCLMRAQKDWEDKKLKDIQDNRDEVEKSWPPMVHEAMAQAEKDARAAGKSDDDVEEERQKAAGYALKVAKDHGLWVPPDDHDDPRTCPLFFQKRHGLEKALAYIKKD